MIARLSALFILLVTSGIAIAADRPNILLFVVDDLGVHDTAAGGSTFYVTPNVDRLARQGMNFNNAYVAHPRCVPSRYALITGRFPARAGIPGGPEKLDEGRTTIAGALQDGGYATYFLGKWHLGGPGGGLPNENGFDVNIAGGEAGAPGSYFYPYTNDKKKADGEAAPILGLEDGQPGEHLTDRLTREAIKLLESHHAQHPDQPFFMELAHYGVHTPLEDTSEMKRKYEERLDAIGRPAGDGYVQKDGTTKQFQDNATYAAMIERVDTSLGQILKALDELDLAEDTVVVFTSDHGGLSNRGENSKRELATSNAPLRAGKGHLFEGGIRVPLIVRWPGRVAAGSTSDALTTNTDHFATFLELAELPPRPADHVDGISYKPALSGQSLPPRGPIYWYSPRPRPTQTGDESSAAIRLGDYKLIHWYADDSLSLFDLKTDPGESDDLAEREPDRAARLDQQLSQWLASIDAVKPRSK